MFPLRTFFLKDTTLMKKKSYFLPSSSKWTTIGDNWRFGGAFLGQQQSHHLLLRTIHDCEGSGTPTYSPYPALTSSHSHPQRQAGNVGSWRIPQAKKKATLKMFLEITYFNSSCYSHVSRRDQYSLGCLILASVCISSRQPFQRGDIFYIQSVKWRLFSGGKTDGRIFGGTTRQTKVIKICVCPTSAPFAVILIRPPNPRSPLQVTF